MIPRPEPWETLVKICGIRDRSTADVAERAGATAIGVVLAPARRRISPETAREIGRDREVPIVGVVVNEAEGSLHEVIELSGIDVVQLSGDEAPALLDAVAIPVIKAIRLIAGQTPDDARRVIDPWLDHRHPAEVILLDAHVDGQYGGTGCRADWSIAAALAERYPIILAGGLTAENVRAGIQQVAPLGVDVSSGVETSGVKDHAKIRRFVSVARDAMQHRDLSRLGGRGAES